MHGPTRKHRGFFCSWRWALLERRSKGICFYWWNWASQLNFDRSHGMVCLVNDDSGWFWMFWDDNWLICNVFYMSCSNMNTQNYCVLLCKLFVLDHLHTLCINVGFASKNMYYNIFGCNITVNVMYVISNQHKFYLIKKKLSIYFFNFFQFFFFKFSCFSNIFFIQDNWMFTNDKTLVSNSFAPYTNSEDSYCTTLIRRKCYIVITVVF